MCRAHLTLNPCLWQVSAETLPPEKDGKPCVHWSRLGFQATGLVFGRVVQSLPCNLQPPLIVLMTHDAHNFVLPRSPGHPWRACSSGPSRRLAHDEAAGQLKMREACFDRRLLLLCWRPSGRTWRNLPAKLRKHPSTVKSSSLSGSGACCSGGSICLPRHC